MEASVARQFQPVLLGSDINVYGMARSFHEEYKVNSLAIGKAILGPCTASKIVRVAVVEPKLEDDKVFVQTLVSFADKFHKASDKQLLLVSCGDNYSKLIARNQDALAPYYAFPRVSEELLVKLSLKESFYALCDTYGLKHPQTLICTFDSYRSIALPFEYPVIVKPSNSVAYWNCHFPHKKKVFLAESEAELKQIMDAIYSSSYKDSLILQEYIPGPDSNMRVVNCYCGRDKKVKLAALGRVLLEEHTPEGIGSYAGIISDKDEAITNKIITFLESVGYAGFANFDMKYDPRDGSYKLFEVNLRQGRSSYFVTAAGYNLAKWMVEDLIEKNDTMPCTIASNKTLWTIVPLKILFTYVSDASLHDEMRELIKQGNVKESYYYENDRSLKRWVHYQKNQINYFKKYKKYFGNKKLVD